MRIMPLAIAGLMAAGCGSSKQMTQPTSVFGSNLRQMPCAEFDSDEYFTATGNSNGSQYRMDIIQTAALTNAQNIVRQKMKHVYKGMIQDYSLSIGTNSGTDADSKMERAGDQIIDAIVNDTRATCGPLFSDPDDKGVVQCFVGIRVNKKQVVDAVSNYISNDEELRIRFNEKNFREQMEKKFKEYKEEQTK